MLTNLENPASMSADDNAISRAEPSTPTASSTMISVKEHKPAGEKPRVLEEVVIEEVSIDGMCGVY